MTEKSEYSFREALRLSGLQEARFRYLEKELGGCIGIQQSFFSTTGYSAQQVSALRKIDSLLQRDGVSLEMVRDRIARYIALRQEGMWIVVVTSGKGGVGKTSMAVNLAVSMARLGLKPTVVDADLGLANAHLVLGVLPQMDLGDLIRGTAGMEDILIRDVYGISLIPGGSGMTSLANLDGEAREYLSEEVQKLYYHADTIVVDTSSGISDNVMRFLRLADEILVVVTPNIASCLDAMGVIRAAEEHGCEGRINILVNRCRNEEEGRDIFCKLHRSAVRMTTKSLWYMGYVPEDRHLEQSFQKGMPVTSCSSACRASRQIRHLARALMADRKDWRGKQKDRVAQIFGGRAAAG